MASVTSRLPSRFPVGTKFVIEGRPGGNGRVFSRYLEFPDGTRLRLPKRVEKRAEKRGPESKATTRSAQRRPHRARIHRS